MEGINNLGATCAINSFIQLICRCEKLRLVVLNSRTDENTFTSELKEIIDLMYNQKKSINPNKFINAFFRIFKGIFNPLEQVDINELLFYIYQKINEETCEEIKNPIKNITNIYEEHDVKIAKYNNNKISPISLLVEGSYINIIICNNCSNKSYSFEPFINMTLDIIENKSIADLIIMSMEDEFREKDDWKCDKCKKNCSYIKTKKIWRMPKTLFITLNRFKDIYKKNISQVFINDSLNFNKGSILTEEENRRYELSGISLHYGNLDGGHYMAVCKTENEYYLYDDINVSKIKKEDLTNEINCSSVYLLLYNHHDIN
jgi:ubiquitin C-terminal hydrolase